MKDTVKRFFKRFVPTFLISFAVILAVNFLMRGLPLLGLPKAEDITRAVVTDHVQGLSVTLESADDLDLAANVPNFLTWKPGAPPEGEAQITIAYTMADGTTQSISANETTVWWHGKARALKKGGGLTFVNVTRGCFLPYATVEEPDSSEG